MSIFLSSTQKRGPISQDHLWLAGILIVALAVRLSVVLFFYSDYQITNDAVQWHKMAVHFLQGKGLVFHNELVPHRTPLPALYLAGVYAIFGISTPAAQIVNSILGVVTVFLIYDLVNRPLGPKPARWSALFVSFYPMILLYTGQLISETLFLFLIALALWLAYRSIDRSIWHWGLTGLVLGLTILTRQPAVLIGAVLAVWVIFFSTKQTLIKRVSAGAMVLICMTLTTSIWVVHNYIKSGRLALTGQGGDSLWLANNPHADGTESEHSSSQSVYIIPEFEDLSEVERGAAYQDAAINWIRDNPWQFLSLIPRRMVWFWHITYHSQNDVLQELAFLAIYLPILGLGIIGAVKTWKSDRAWLQLLLTVPIALTLVHAIYLPAGRYRLPVELVLCVLAGPGLVAIIENVSTKQARRSGQL